MENENNTIGWGVTKVTYEIMTDSKGEKWCVPITVNGEVCEYLKKVDPSSDTGTFDVITPTQ